MTVNIACEIHVTAFVCITQANRTLLDCIMCLDDLGSAYQCILGNAYLSSDLSSKY